MSENYTDYKALLHRVFTDAVRTMNSMVGLGPVDVQRVGDEFYDKWIEACGVDPDPKGGA